MLPTCSFTLTNFINSQVTERAVVENLYLILGSAASVSH